MKVKSVLDRLPPNDKVVVAIRESGYKRTPYEILSAYYDGDLKAWFDIGGDHVTESGSDILFWMPDEQEDISQAVRSLPGAEELAKTRKCNCRCHHGGSPHTWSTNCCPLAVR